MRIEAHIAPQADRLSAAFEHSITWEDDLWRADPVDVEAIHAHARRKFSELLDAVTAERGPRARRASCCSTASRAPARPISSARCARPPIAPARPTSATRR